MRFLIMLLVGILLTSCTADRYENIEDPLKGLWKIVVIETHDASGNLVEANWMKNGKAYLHYDGHSTMSLHFLPENYRDLKKLVKDNSSHRDTKPYWYLAHYQVFPEKQLVKHKRIIHSDPDEWGKEVLRYFEFNGDTLILRPEEFDLRLKWVRCKEEDRSGINS